MIGVIDYGLGNVNAFLNCYKELNISAVAVSDSNTLASYSHIILPGVGAFDEAMNLLNGTGFGKAILSYRVRIVFVRCMCRYAGACRLQR